MFVRCTWPADVITSVGSHRSEGAFSIFASNEDYNHERHITIGLQCLVAGPWSCSSTNLHAQAKPLAFQITEITSMTRTDILRIPPGHCESDHDAGGNSSRAW